MFLDRDELINLQKYTEKVRDKELFRWWGHYFESMSNMENAITCYKQAGDNLSLCRVFCYNDNIKAAIELCNDTSDSSACYHLARQFERNKNWKESINYYQRAGAISNAIRICKENEMQACVCFLWRVLHVLALSKRSRRRVLFDKWTCFVYLVKGKQACSHHYEYIYSSDIPKFDYTFRFNF